MNDEEMRVKITEACGWTLEPAGKDSFGVYYAAFWRHPDKPGIHTTPDYLNDLNAMHEAEKTLTDEQCDKYDLELHTIRMKEEVGDPLD